MFLYNTTYLVPDKVNDTWLKWVKDKHIPFMLGTTYFNKPQIARIITNNQEEGTSFSVQFHVQDIHTLKLWNQEFRDAFQGDFFLQFGTEVVFFSTVLELIE
jgi:hypothetical protein